MQSIQHTNGTKISPHLQLREQFQRNAGVRPVKAYPNIPQKLGDPRATSIDFIVIRETTKGLFHSAAVHNRSHIEADFAIEKTMRITRKTAEKPHKFTFNLAGKSGAVTCIDKANVFNFMAFFQQIFDEISADYLDVAGGLVGGMGMAACAKIGGDMGTVVVTGTIAKSCHSMQTSL